MEDHDGLLSPNMMPSPSDMVGPSPVTSNGTETTEIEDAASEDVESADSTDSSRTEYAEDKGRSSSTTVGVSYLAKVF